MRSKNGCGVSRVVYKHNTQRISRVGGSCGPVQALLLLSTPRRLLLVMMCLLLLLLLFLLSVLLLLLLLLALNFDAEGKAYGW
jgi:hypothetical protein